MTWPFWPGSSCSDASSLHAWSRARGSFEGSMPKSSRVDTPSATPRHIEAANVASASFLRRRILSGWGFWQLLALKQRGEATGRGSWRRSLLGERLRTAPPLPEKTLLPRLAWLLIGIVVRTSLSGRGGAVR